MSKTNIRKKILNIRKKNNFNLKLNNTYIRKIFKKYEIKKKLVVGGYYPINYEIDCLQILKKLSSKKYLISLFALSSESEP